MEIPKSSKKKKTPSPESQLRFAFDNCLKTQNLAAALALYTSALAANTPLNAYHFNSLLHVISASLTPTATSSLISPVAVQDAVNAGLRIFDHMLAAGAVPTEATVTSVARIAANQPHTGAETAFQLVKSMKDKYGAVPKLRTYGPALFAFCDVNNAVKAYEVETHMNEGGIVLEEAEIAALLEVSVKVGNADKVYEYLQKLRAIGCVSEGTAEGVERWFRSEVAAGVGEDCVDMGKVSEAVERNGGGWHGLGWLGKGRWEVRRGGVCVEGRCEGCGQRLAGVDIDVEETEKFAGSVARLALERETNSNFKDFQEWLDSHAEYDAVVDGANVGYYQQNFAEGGFSLSQLDIVVKELFERSESKWPLILLHKRRVNDLMENPSYKELIQTWIANDALYVTPTGSNDDWYWLYAAVKLKSLLVTNDEMRDHIFELLGRNYILKWKERHQVKYTFVKGNMKLLLPSPYSPVIQESETGSWHVPIDEKCSDERRAWLCITRAGSCVVSNEADLAAQCNESSENMQKTPMVANGNANCVPDSSSSLKPPLNKSVPVTGKRKEREPQLSKAFTE